MAHDASPHALSDYEVERLAEHLDAVLGRLLAREDREAATAVVGLLEGLERIHAEGIRRLAELVARDAEQLRRAARDPVISSLFDLYELTLPQPRSDSGTVQPPGAPGVPDLIDPGGVSPTGDTSVLPEQKLVQLRRHLERAKPGSDPSSAAASPADARSRPREGRLGLDELERDRPTGFTVGRTSVLLLLEGERVHAFLNACPGTPLPLHTGEYSGGVLTCPWHGCRFDLPSGERLDGGGTPLSPLSTRIVDGDVVVSV